ncbi:MAG: restriction endonuclease, partial [Nitrososphaerales archaeon]
MKNSIVTVGWNDLPDLSNVETRENLKSIYEKTYPTEKSAISSRVGQAWAFAKKIQIKDLVVLPLKLQSAIAIGEVTGPYAYRTNISSDVRHIHPIKWIKTDFPRTAFDQDLLYSFGAYMTVCQITRNNAEARLRALIQGKTLPSPAGETTEEETFQDLEQLGRDQVQELISQRFRGHELARLVEAVLQAQGYKTDRSPPGPDGGVDILAGKGPFAF